MTTQHTKSSCCQAAIIKYSERRRQCKQCKKTWRRYKHKRGRKRKRANYQVVKKLLLKGQRIADRKIDYPHLKERALAKRIERSIQSFVSKPRQYPKLKGKYILLSDGLWFHFGGCDYVLFLLLLKPRRRNTAYLLDPVIFPGKETYSNWKSALATIPENIRKRIISLVSDNFKASSQIIQHFGWTHQLCHFHLLEGLQKRRGKIKRNIRGRSIREEIYQTVVQLLSTLDSQEKRFLIRKLRQLTCHPDCPRKLTMMVHGFLKALDKYHTYLTHPSLTIPRTTSPVESLNKLIVRRTRHLKTPEAVINRATAFVRLKKIITCNSSKRN